VIKIKVIYERISGKKLDGIIGGMKKLQTFKYRACKARITLEEDHSRDFQLETKSETSEVEE
jgi:hypothetical protein